LTKSIESSIGKKNLIEQLDGAIPNRISKQRVLDSVLGLNRETGAIPVRTRRCDPAFYY
jgi:hypothetical protein